MVATNEALITNYQGANDIIVGLTQNNKILSARLDEALYNLNSMNKKYDDALEIFKTEFTFRDSDRDQIINESKGLFHCIENTELSSRRDIKVSNEIMKKITLELEQYKHDLHEIDSIIVDMGCSELKKEFQSEDI